MGHADERVAAAEDARRSQRGFEKYHVDEELQRYLRDVQDHTIRIVERADGFARCCRTS